MEERALRRILQGVLVASLAAPAVYAAAACGSGSTSTGGGDASSSGGSSGACTIPPCGCNAPPAQSVPIPADADIPDGAVDDSGHVNYNTCMALCAPITPNCGCLIGLDDAGQRAIGCGGCACAGRRPAGLASRGARRGATAVGGHLAELAYLEAASVTAFARLADELRAHGAPRRLVVAAERSRGDEVRHARVMAGLARRFGGRTSAPRVARARARSLEAMALENAVEGCVRETYGALEAMWRARAAGSPGVRASMKRIARDETRHAALAWSVARWAEHKLGAPARARVRAARREALASLLREIESPVHPEVVRLTGAPTVGRARALAEGLGAALLSASRDC